MSRYRPLVSVCRWSVVLLWLSAAWAIVQSFGAAFVRADDEAELYAVVSWTGFGVGLATAIVFLLWFGRALGNLPALRVGPERRSTCGARATPKPGRTCGGMSAHPRR